MLPAAHRMRRPSQFAKTIRSGRRAGGRVIVAHQVRAEPAHDIIIAEPAVVGLIVGKGVGNSVVRHRVSRRLRAQLACRLDRLPGGSATVIRALPASAGADSAQLGQEIDRALARIGQRR